MLCPKTRAGAEVVRENRRLESHVLRGSTGLCSGPRRARLLGAPAAGTEPSRASPPTPSHRRALPFLLRKKKKKKRHMVGYPESHC